MIINITSRRAKIEDDFKQRVEKKLSKLDRFFHRDVKADVIVTTEKEDEREKVEVTIKSNGVVYRGERTAPSMFDSLEAAVDAIVKQIIKNKTRLEKRLHSNNFVPKFDEADFNSQEDKNNKEESYKIVKQKLYTSKPMLPDEAILQMNMVGHSFFIFINAQTGKVNIVYKRNQGDYGLIIPEEE
ncbi:MAG: ribosome-associated translation inhibitor RaiA [Oscillospiraceae bacterium]|nr:ribosome-associated translation inhibitor RaiA [Oscillospiraceae bacterium]